MHSISQLFHLEKVENLIMGGFIALRALPGLLTDVVGVVLCGGAKACREVSALEPVEDSVIHSASICPAPIWDQAL